VTTKFHLKKQDRFPKESINDVINNPSKTGTSVNRATGNPATAFFDENGAYVVKDDVTDSLVQISDKTDPNWKVDPEIKMSDDF
jgi:hypothetical protein